MCGRVRLATEFSDIRRIKFEPALSCTQRSRNRGHEEGESAS